MAKQLLTSATIRKQAERLYMAVSDLVRRYQFRDRDQICCHGLTASQCYTLEALEKAASMTMGELAAHLSLKMSSMTRVVDHLVASGLVKRCDDPADRRVCRVQISNKGRSLLGKVKADLLGEYERVLRTVPLESREAVIEAVLHLVMAFEQRCCSENSAVELRIGK